jgi:hypothetical protein
MRFNDAPFDSLGLTAPTFADFAHILGCGGHPKLQGQKTKRAAPELTRTALLSKAL